MDKTSNPGGDSSRTTNNNNDRTHGLRKINKVPHKSSKPSSSSSSSLPVAVNRDFGFPPQSLHQHQPPVCEWTHDVFPSFRGEDIRRNFLSHVQKEFRSKGIILFVDNNIKRGKSIGPELIKAIRRSKVAIILLSRNYASSKWCLDELAEIMKCKNELDQIVFPVFYEVDPSHVKKLTREFGAVFKKTCAGQSKEDIRRWRQAFSEVATIAGCDSRTWDNEAVMIEEIVTEISKRLISSKPSRYMEGLIGMGAHIEKLKPLICLGSDEVRTVGIWGPCGIGKTTIARFLYNQISGVFQQSVFMTFKPNYARPICSDDHDERLHLEQQFLSQLNNQGDIKIPHLGAAQNSVMHKKLLVIYDGVEQLVQLDAMPQARYFGPGSRIIITTQNLRLLNAFKIEHIYQVNFPPHEEALQIFCMSAFGQSSPYHGYEELAWEVTELAGRLPLGLRIMGSHFRGILSKQEWKAELPRLRFRLDGEIKSILKFSYDALEKEDRDLFLYIACFFADITSSLDDDGTFEDVLKHIFSNVRQGLKVLVQRALVSRGYPPMHNLLVKLGREIVREESPRELGKCEFLVDPVKICEVLADNTGSGSVILIHLEFSSMEDEEDGQDISERAFENMTNLQFLRIEKRLHLPRGLTYLSPKLRILHWDHYPLKSLPSNFNPKFLVKILLCGSKLEKLWEGIQPLTNLKLMNLKFSKNLKELPDLSTATNLLELSLKGCRSLIELPSSIRSLINLRDANLSECSSLVELPFCIGNLTNLQKLNLSKCSSLVELPFCITKLTNLQRLNLTECSSLVELPFSIGNLKHLNIFDCSSLLEVLFSSIIGNCIRLRGLSSLVGLPFSIGNLTNLEELNLNTCSNLKELPSTLGNIISLKRIWLHGCSSLVKLPSSIGDLTNLQKLDCEGCSNLVELPSSIGSLTNLKELYCKGCSNLVELPSSIGNLTNLQNLDCKGCSNLVELPSSIGSLTNLQKLDCEGCSNLVELPSSIGSLTNLDDLHCKGCSNLVDIPSSLENFIITSDSFVDCLQLRSSIVDSMKIMILKLDTSSIKSWSRLSNFSITYCKELEEFPYIFDMITELELNDEVMEEIPRWVSGMTRLRRLVLNKCRKLVSLPQLPGTMDSLVAKDCDSLERLACSSPYRRVRFEFTNCLKLNEETRDIIIQRYSRSSFSYPTILPGKEVHAFFTYRSRSGSSLTVKLDQKRPFPTILIFKACVLLVSKGEKEARYEEHICVSDRVLEYLRPLLKVIVDKQSDRVLEYEYEKIYLRPLLKEHLYLFQVSLPNMDSSEFIFEFKLKNDKWKIAECGVRVLYEEDWHVDDE